MYASLFRLLRDSIEWWCFTSGVGARVKKKRGKIRERARTQRRRRLVLLYFCFT
jgi:hypothetical protein